MRVPDTTSPAKQKAADTGASSGSGAAEEVEAVEKFTVAELRAGARRLLGVSRHIVAGAFALEKKVEWTAEEAKRKVTDFLNEEVPQSDHAKAQGRTV
jgi:hypothetical protein